VKPQGASARPYAKALFALAKDRGQADAVAGELRTVVDVVAGDAALRAFFQRPWVAPATKRAVAAEVAARIDVSQLVRDFLALVVAQGRGDHLDAIAATYRDLLDEDLGRVRARVRTAVTLSDGERAALATKLGRALGGKQVVIEEAIDRSLLGGFVAESGSVIVDGSLDAQLARLRRRLATA
jgi:F-type H+-transporting ATPase subunit delta